MRQLLRFEGTRPGLERFFGDAEVTVTYGGVTRASEKLPGRELLARWQRDGFPLARGTIKVGVPRCGALTINAKYDHVPAADPEGALLFMACFANDLQVTSLTLTIPK